MKFFKKIGTSISLFFSKIVLFFQKYFIDFFKDKDLTKRIIFTLSMLALFVALGSITIPGVSVDEGQLQDTDFLGIMNTIGGGGLRQFSLVALGISPFISASLVMTFAQTSLCPPIQRLSQSGPLGRMKINVITKILSFFFGIIQAIILTQTLLGSRADQFGISLDPGFDNTWFIYFVLPCVLIAGSFFSVFISEEITNKGVGNGTSLIILSGILISLPTKFTTAYNQFIANSDDVMAGIIYFGSYILIIAALMYIVNLMYQAERRVPIQHTGVGRSKSLKDISYLPLKINAAGVMPIIFAMLTTTVPTFIAGFVDMTNPNAIEGVIWVRENFQLTKPLGLSLFAVSTFSLTILMSLQQSRLDKIVEDFNKNTTFVPGLRPGEQTEDYLTSIVLRLSVFAAFYLTILGSFEYIAIIIMNAISPAVYAQYYQLLFGGTTLIILVSVSIETITQIQARIKTQEYIKHKKIEVVETYNFDSHTRDVEISNYNSKSQNEDGGDGSFLW